MLRFPDDIPEPKTGPYDRWRAATIALTGADVCPELDVVSPRDILLQHYLDRLGVRHFTAEEAIAIAHPERAGGETTHLPHVSAWTRGGALLLLADRLRDAAGSPVKCRNWYRPPEYNAAVGGAPDSDHVTACALDLDFSFYAAISQAREVLASWWRSDLWGLSLGLGAATIHLGLWAPRTLELGRQRIWYYDSLRGSERERVARLFGR